MAVTPRGSYCRDLLETSRLLDLYSILGIPLHVTLGYPSAGTTDPRADPDFRIAAGHWREGYTPQIQAEWASSFVALSLCKPSVQAVTWAHVNDAEPHQFPHCGLLDSAGRPKPIVQALQPLRAAHLR